MLPPVCLQLGEGRERKLCGHYVAARERGALSSALLVAGMERIHPVECQPMCPRVGRGCAGLVAQRQDRPDRAVQGRLVDHDQVPERRLRVGHPGAGEAVGLELDNHRGSLDPRSCLDRVAHLVREDDRRCQGTEGLVELGHEERRVVGDVVVTLAAAVEGIALDVGVGEVLAVALPRAAARGLRLESAGEVVEGLAVDLRESRRPVVTDAGLRRGQHFGEVTGGVA
jgi:hypothetical protein